jgi:hypothetical protein
MANLRELERTASRLEASASQAASMLDAVHELLAVHRSELHRWRQTVELYRASPVTATQVLEFITVDDELMADLDAIVSMNKEELRAAMAAADRRRDVAFGVEAAAERALGAVYRSLLDEMHVAGSSSVGEVVGGRADVYRVLTTAVDAVLTPAQTGPLPIEELATGAR